MVDITEKDVVYREAIAEGIIRLRRETLERIKKGMVEKGDVFEISKAVALSSAKLTPTLLPFCHPIRLTNVSIDYQIIDENRLKVIVKVKAVERTGVEMEALTAVSLALLNIWDMVKKYEKDEKGQYPETWIEYIKVIEKRKDNANK
ncbi:molybdenum cofactor biosynthesis protein MoaC [Ignicoccus pacificus DSM 13166]|uniref:Molybdenum cofactor biosynthesis protein MoaC n=1 Tax=Ignicoccus pacificus DSM 13166 TaxID=940294 RepID=A0A977K9E4_9CREN|nr:molybdenum cofactor biosynthesis protein MoaC [Ignicoccus pacificus DSM 13166]